MILEAIRAQYVEKAAQRTMRPNPSGSRLGGCAAAMQMLVYPELTKPERYQPRAVMVFETGDSYEKWLSARTHEAFPGLWGMQQQPFYLRVPIPPEFAGRSRASIIEVIASRLRRDADDRTRTPFFGWPIESFTAPKISLSEKGSVRLRGTFGGKYQPAVVLDRESESVYVAVYVDGVIKHPVYGLTIVEFKSMSNFAFRRALMGDMDYRYRCQLAAAVTGAAMTSAVWLVVRKETSHLAEISFQQGEDRTTIKLTAPNGSQEVYFVTDRARGLVEQVAGGDAGPIPADSEWETAEVTTPFDAAVLDGIYARVLRVLLAQPGQWYREYGPDFRCAKCAGVGTRVCTTCAGTAFSTKTGKPCVSCAIGAKYASGVLGKVRCKACAGAGLLEVAELGFPCSYCPTVLTCWQPANIVRTIDTKPHYLIRGTDFLASGLGFTAPEPLPVVPPVGRDDDTEGEAESA
jgi:hypothetical protein